MSLFGLIWTHLRKELTGEASQNHAFDGRKASDSGESELRSSKGELTERQRQCLEGILNLKSGKEIARELGISAHAVEKHLRASRDKLGATSSADAARLFAAQGRRGGDFPQYGFTELPTRPAASHELGALAKLVPIGTGGTRVIEGDDYQLRPLSAGRTLAAIAAIAFLSIASLLMLIACAQALDRLFG